MFSSINGMISHRCKGVAAAFPFDYERVLLCKTCLFIYQLARQIQVAGRVQVSVMEPVKIIVILFAVVFLFLTVIFSGLSNVGRLGRLHRETKLFPNDFGRGKVLVEPVQNVFAVWVFNYIYQFAWVCYSLSLIFRPGAPDILNKKFYGSYISAMVFNIVWMLIWTQRFYALGFVFYVLQALALNLSLYFACTGCLQYLQSFPTADTRPSTVDLWAVRLLVINGIAFFAGWVSVTALVNMSVVFQIDFDVGQIAASRAALSLLLVGILVWSVLGNFVCEVHTRFMFAEYLGPIIILAGIISKKWQHHHEEIRSYALAVFIIDLMLLIFRVGMILTRETKRGALVSYHKEPGEKVNLV